MKTLKLGVKQIQTLLCVAVDTAILQHGLETCTVSVADLAICWKMTGVQHLSTLNLLVKYY